MDAVKVGSDTLRKRLEEFQNTPVAYLTRQEFESKTFDTSTPANPPSCPRPIKSSLKLEDSIENQIMLTMAEESYD
jgi:hypothetical protein